MNAFTQFEIEHAAEINALTFDSPHYPFISPRHRSLFYLFAESFIVAAAAAEACAIIEAHGGIADKPTRFGMGYIVKGSIARDAIKAALKAANVDFEVYG